MAYEWDVTYPGDHTLISKVPEWIRNLKASAKEQFDHEHETPVAGDATGGEHMSGSAVAFEGSATPTARPGGATLGDNAIDRGRLWFDDTYDPPMAKRWDGTAFEEFIDVHDLDGTPTRVYTKFLTGTLDADASTSVAHGVTAATTKIHAVAVMCYDGTSSVWRAPSASRSGISAEEYEVEFDATNIIIHSVGAYLQGQAYKIKIDYIL